jgi:uracil phosphoribosyltransferase
MSTATSNVNISKHPVLHHKISILRSSATSQRTFRSVIREVTYHLGYEASSSLKTREVPISVCVGKEKLQDHMDCTGVKISDRVALIPILRSGLGMADGMLELLPKASVHHIGMYHLPGTAPVQYFNRLPKKCESDIAYVVDPVVASAETMMAVIAILKRVSSNINIF